MVWLNPAKKPNWKLQTEGGRAYRLVAVWSASQLLKRLCKINPKNECHIQVFSELSQKAQPSEPNHCSALLLHNPTEFLRKNVMEIFKMMEIVEFMELMELMKMLELMEMMDRMEKMIQMMLIGNLSCSQVHKFTSSD